ncbi:Desosaminyl transferase EryCIII precursor [Micromonospora sp. MW-13]|uniref:SaqGT1 n=1 Tax=Micromonospora sp. Tu 6368 TaxID=428986 RepID=C4NYK7_9ACTN|nr:MULTISPECIES: activator-dependent family glycosyltransferase [unclassified Micromonospora]ACP19361.1 SaqGT1 [Micromonospora sp. Tu 6368]MCX4469497.1 activator-dependent family glycosyltransferase [Micromonospora sp. NBC_01655]RGC65134.1 Desosaminyl transferase EryCIII precursor [Micromonospora sp. MW-13]
MRILFAIFPAAAHLYPITPLAWALQAAGHEVRVATSPNIAGTIEAAGLTAVPAGGPVQLASEEEERLERPTDVLVLDHSHETAWRTVARYLTGLFIRTFPDPEPGADHASMADDLVAFARGWQPDLVVWDTLNPVGMVAAKASGAAHARLLWGLDNVAWLSRKFREQPGGQLYDDPLVCWLEPLLNKYGCAFDEEAITGQWTLDLVPSRMRLPLDLRYVPVRRVAYSGASTVPDWLREPPGRPRVCLTLGVSSRTVYNKYRGFPIAELFDHIADLDIELVATLNRSQLAEVRKVPDNVRTVDYVPLRLLLPTCSAIVHHGGGGTTAAAVEQRVPHLIIPVPKWDEENTARHVVSRGAGLAMDGQDFSVAEFRRNLLRLLDEPSFQRGADALYEDMLATPSPVETVPVLERLTAQAQQARAAAAR